MFSRVLITRSLVFYLSSNSDAMNAGQTGAANYNTKKVEDSITPVTVKQLSDAVAMDSQDDNFKLLTGKTIGLVTIVGKVVRKEETASHLTYAIDDGTGVVECKEFVSEDGEGQRENLPENDDYVRITGKMKSLNDNRNLQTMNCRKITDFNEVAFHFLDAMYASSRFTSEKGADVGVATGNAPAAYAMPTSGNNTETAGSLQDQLLTIYNNPSGPASGDSGIELSEVVKLLGEKYTFDAVREAVEFLSNEGHVYSTISDEHHRSTSI